MPDPSTVSVGPLDLGFDRHVAFDFDGALQLARRLVALADEWERAFATFDQVADGALESWSGPRRDRAAERIAAHRRDSAAVVASLRSEASGWARAWADAADELRHERWIAATAVTVDGPPISVPLPVAVPLPPQFEPTVAPVAPLAMGGPR